MSVDLSCFKAYDIRGKVPAQLNKNVAYAVGFAFAKHFNAKHVVSGHDARLSGAELQNALMAGLEAGGASVYDIGLCNTEEIYYASARKKGEDFFFDGGIMVTGSHNPADENGLKFVRGGAIPVSGDTGLLEIKNLVAQHIQSFCKHPDSPVAKEEVSFRNEYLDYLCRSAPVSQYQDLKIYLDPGNGCGGLLARPLCEKMGIAFSGDNLTPDGHFPNGVPNPLLLEKRARTADAVRKHGASLGVAWDGDADRCFFYDEDGNFVEGYYLVGLIAQAMLKRFPGAKIIHDPRLYWNTVDLVVRSGGFPVQSKTGHAFIKERMRAEDAVYGGEMSAHHYFREFSYCDNGSLPWLLVLGLMAESGRTLGEMVHDRAECFPCSGEINSSVQDATSVMRSIEAKYAPDACKTEHIDGLSMEFGTWRFNLRSSNTEPLLRLNVESKGEKALMEDKTQELLHLIRNYR